MKHLISFILAVLLLINTFFFITPSAFADTTADYVSEDHLSGQFSVPANLEEGVSFTNKTSREVSVTLSTEGKWSISTNTVANSFDANGASASDIEKGDLSDDTDFLQFSENPPFSLLAVDESKKPPVVKVVGKENNITVASGAIVRFLINEISTDYVPGAYEDNTGSINIKWSSTPPNSLAQQPTNISNPDIKDSIDLSGIWYGEFRRCLFYNYIDKLDITVSQNNLAAKTLIETRCVPKETIMFKGIVPKTLHKGDSFPITTIFAYSDASEFDNPKNPTKVDLDKLKIKFSELPAILTIINNNSFTISVDPKVIPPNRIKDPGLTFKGFRSTAMK